MKVFRVLIMATLLAGFVFAFQPAATHAQEGEEPGPDGPYPSCEAYASEFSGVISAYNGQVKGSFGPFVGGVFTFTFTEVDPDVGATVRLVADPAGATTLAGPTSVPGTLSFTMPADVGSQPTGLGFYFDSGNEGSVNIAISCGEGVLGCTAYLPPQAVVGQFMSNAEVYWTPGETVSPSLVIEAGKTYYVAGQDASEQYYKVLISCDWVWVLKSTVGPNYDDVWQDQPLPQDIVE